MGDLPGWKGGVDGAPAAVLASKRTVAVEDAAVELQGFEAGADRFFFAELAAEADLGVDFEEEDEVGAETGGGERVQRAEACDGETAPESLVGKGAAFEAVAEDDGAAVEGGTDDPIDHLGAGDEEGEKLGAWGEVEVEEAAYLFTGGSATRLAAEDDLVAGGAQGFGDGGCGRALTGAFSTFECDEQAGHEGSVWGGGLRNED